MVDLYVLGFNQEFWLALIEMLQDISALKIYLLCYYQCFLL